MRRHFEVGYQLLNNSIVDQVNLLRWLVNKHSKTHFTAHFTISIYEIIKCMIHQIRLCHTLHTVCCCTRTQSEACRVWARFVFFVINSSRTVDKTNILIIFSEKDMRIFLATTSIVWKAEQMVTWRNSDRFCKTKEERPLDRLILTKTKWWAQVLKKKCVVLLVVLKKVWGNSLYLRLEWHRFRSSIPMAFLLFVSFAALFAGKLCGKNDYNGCLCKEGHQYCERRSRRWSSRQRGSLLFSQLTLWVSLAWRQFRSWETGKEQRKEPSSLTKICCTFLWLFVWGITRSSLFFGTGKGNGKGEDKKRARDT